MNGARLTQQLLRFGDRHPEKTGPIDLDRTIGSHRDCPCSVRSRKWNSIAAAGTFLNQIILTGHQRYGCKRRD